MRLLFFADSFIPVVGGAERFLDRLASEMCGRGHDVRVLAPRVRHRDNRVDAPYRLIRHPKPRSKRYLPRHTVVYLAGATLGWRPDCLHAQSSFPAGYAAAAYCRWADIPWVVRPVGADVLPGESTQRNPRRAARSREALTSATRVVAQSASLEARIRDLGVPAGRVVRIPNGVDVAESTSPSPRDDATIAALGMLFEKKGFDVLVDAMRLLVDRVPTARLEIGGEGVERERLEARIRDHGLEANVELRGVLDEPGKRELLERATVFVSSSRREPFSNANLEALAAGLPMVATAVGGNLEMVTDGHNGFLVPTERPAALADGLERVLRDPELAARFGAESRRVAETFSWPVVSACYERLYEEISRRTTRRRGRAP